MLMEHWCLYWAAIIHVLFTFCHELFLHVVFAEAVDSYANSICLNLQFPVFLA